MFHFYIIAKVCMYALVREMIAVSPLRSWLKPRQRIWKINPTSERLFSDSFEMAGLSLAASTVL